MSMSRTIANTTVAARQGRLIMAAMLMFSIPKKEDAKIL
jgi:hypothetical protein